MAPDRTRYALTLLLSLAFAIVIVWGQQAPLKES